MSSHWIKARVVETFFLSHHGAWVVEIDGLEGVVRAGQMLTIFDQDGELGPFQLRRAGYLLHREAGKAVENIGLVLSARQKHNLSGVADATAIITDSPY